MPLGSLTCTIRSTSSAFYPTQHGQYLFRVSAQENIKLPLAERKAVFLKTKRAHAALNSPDRIEVTVHTASEEHTTTQANDHDSYDSTNEPVHEKPNAWGLGDDVERGL